MQILCCLRLFTQKPHVTAKTVRVLRHFYAERATALKISAFRGGKN